MWVSDTNVAVFDVVAAAVWMMRWSDSTMRWAGYAGRDVSLVAFITVRSLLRLFPTV